ncbi:hypothetical protein J6590_009134 [Homalodisca vitripennis]|nr:hypothetical protein J6590_009134 [Homalodisca vitripennis]
MGRFVRGIAKDKSAGKGAERWGGNGWFEISAPPVLNNMVSSAPNSIWGQMANNVNKSPLTMDDPSMFLKKCS